MLPIIQLDRDRQAGFAGLISDASLLDVQTVYSDGSLSGVKALRSGTVAQFTGSAPDAVDSADKGASVGKSFVAIAHSHYTNDQFANNVSNVVDQLPANGVGTGRVWMICKSTTGIVRDNAVSVAALDAGKGIRGWVEKPATADIANAIPGWSFTGRVGVHPGDKFNDGADVLIAEVEVRRQIVRA